MARKIYEIAQEIEQTWCEKVTPYARPYLDAMHDLSSMADHYFCDTADSVVRYFLANATTWRGEDARRIKAELKALLK